MIKSRTWQVHAHQDWVKAVLIKLIVQQKASVCQLWCGDGIDMGKWNRAEVASFFGIDENNDLLMKAKKRLQQKGCTFTEQFVHIDIRKDLIEKTNIPLCDHVVCFQGFISNMVSGTEKPC